MSTDPHAVASTVQESLQISTNYPRNQRKIDEKYREEPQTFFEIRKWTAKTLRNATRRKNSKIRYLPSSVHTYKGNHETYTSKTEFHHIGEEKREEKKY